MDPLIKINTVYSQGQRRFRGNLPSWQFSTPLPCPPKDLYRCQVNITHTNKLEGGSVLVLIASIISALVSCRGSSSCRGGSEDSEPLSCRLSDFSSGVDPGRSCSDGTVDDCTRDGVETSCSECTEGGRSEAIVESSCSEFSAGGSSGSGLRGRSLKHERRSKRRRLRRRSSAL